MIRDCLKRRMACGIAAGVMLLAGTVDISQSASLSVSPGVLVIHGVRPGKVYSIYEVSKRGLTINNRGDKPNTFFFIHP